jgi:dolichol-phosphate mannosyltransferase
MNAIILLPTYNECENVAHIIPMIFNILPAIRVMVVDDNSPDGTAEVVKLMQPRFPNLLLYQRAKKEGLGRAYTDAFRKVLAEFPNVDVVCTMDADLSHDHAALPDMLKKIETHDVVIGSRYVAGGRLEGWEFHRRMLSRCGNAYVRAVTHLPTHDCTSGFSCIRVSALKRLDFSLLNPSGYAFLIALKYALWKSGARIAEYPITFRSRLSGESKISMRIIEEGIMLPWRLITRKKITTDVCPICKTDSGQYWFEKNHCTVRRCASCGLVFVSPLPDDTAVVYGKDYFCGAEGGHGYINYDEDKAADTKSFSAYLDRIEGSYPAKGRLLDVGAATGAFCSTALARGWEAAGLEISDYAAAAGRAKGMDIRTGTLDTADFPPGSFDVITLWDVFEHIRDPHMALERMAALLKPDGVLAMNLPNAGSRYARLMGRHWALIIPPEHLHLFNPDNLARLLAEHNFSQTLQTYIGKSYTLAYMFQVLSTIHKNALWKRLSDRIRGTTLNRMPIPIHLRDNMFVIARKRQ